MIKFFTWQEIEEKHWKEGENLKEEFKNETTTIKLFTFIYYIWKRIYFARKCSLGKCSLYHS